KTLHLLLPRVDQSGIRPAYEQSPAAAVPGDDALSNARNRPPAAPVFQQGGRNWEIAMSDDKTKRAPQDANFIDFEEDDEIEYWTNKFDVTRAHLARAVGRVGRSAEAVEKYLKH